MSSLLILWIAAALLTTTWNSYIQLVIADNWPPTNRHAIAWEAVLILLTLCLLCWPLVLILMWLDNQREEFRKALRRDSELKRALQVIE